jgi:hypothetical protein
MMEQIERAVVKGDIDHNPPTSPKAACKAPHTR